MPREYIILPAQGLDARSLGDFLNHRPVAEIVGRAGGDARAAAVGLVRAGRRPNAAPYTVLKSDSEFGPKLVKMDPAVARVLRAFNPQTRIEPNAMVFCAVLGSARVARSRLWHPAKSDGVSRKDWPLFRVRVLDENKNPVSGARVLALEANRDVGLTARTSKLGMASFRLPPDQARLPRLCVEAPPQWHGRVRRSIRIAGTETVDVALRSVDPSAQVDAVARWRRDLPADAGAGARIGIVDTGVDPAHPDLTHVVCEQIEIDESQGSPGATTPHSHANHVAGLIGARGMAFRGMAPKAELFSMRVTAFGADKCSSFQLGRGIEVAADKYDLHLINISMAMDQPSGRLIQAAARAFRNGAVCIAAAGNDGQNGVSFPAANKFILGVAAYADRSVLAPDSVELREVGPVASRSDVMLSRARFSNFGPDLDFIAPGVGIISCRANSGYAVASGTSFATPVITGLAAALLARDHPDVLAMPKGPQRAMAIVQALIQQGFDLGFSPDTQGSGMLHV